MVQFTKDGGAVYRADNGRIVDVSFVFQTPLGSKFRQWAKKNDVESATLFYRRAYSVAANRWREREPGVWHFDYGWHKFEAMVKDGVWSVKCIFTDTRSQLSVDEILEHALLACHIREYNGWNNPRPPRQTNNGSKYGMNGGYTRAYRRPYYGRTASWGSGRRAGR